MKKISAVLAGVLIVGSIASTAAFAAMPSSRVAVAQGQIVEQCRNMEELQPREHNSHLAVNACVQRLEHVNQTY